jgi:TPR repeat protein/DNA-binding transcriptional regulator GbsR (MarR family)
MKIASVYNPQEMPEDQFVERFVVRRDTLESLLQQIRSAAPGQQFKHTIIQGLRGQGKTTLLRKLSICVRDDAELSPWLIPILFREEEYSVTTLCRLWELAAEHLDERPAFEGLSDQYEEAYQSPHYEKDCFLILAEALEKTDKTLLLLIDNLGEMLGKFGIRDQQRLREILTTSRRIRIVGASAITLEQHYDQGKPFFQFFIMKSLDGLNAEETRDLLLGLGDEEQTQKMEEILRTRPGKVEALRRLTSGVPRTLILLFEIFLDDHGSALHDLDMLLDRVTPLYKHRLDDLPPQQQAIVTAIALGWDAMSTKEIAQKTRLASKLVSAQLNQLEKNRIVRRIPTSTKNHLYQLEERFFNIWCLMRLGRKNDRRRATWLVRFLETWCDEQELAERAERHLYVLREGKLEVGHALLWSQALAQSICDLELQQRVLDTTREVLPQVSENLPESDYSLFAKANEAYQKGDLKNAFNYIQPLADKGYPDAMFKAALLYQQQGKLEQAERYYLMAVEKGGPYAMINLAVLYEDQGNLEKAERYYLMAVEKGDPGAMLNLAILYDEQDKLEQAEHYYLMAVKKGNINAISNLAELYRNQGKLEQAEYYYLMLVEKGDIDSMHNLATLYFLQAKLPREALELSRKGVEIYPSAKGNLHLGVIALWNGEYSEAFTAIDNALKEFGAEIQDLGDVLIYFPIIMLVAKGQPAFALKLFEDERYQNLNFKERFKPFYYAVLQEVGESRKDDALRMGLELEETVAEIRAEITALRQQHRLRLPMKSGAST